MSRARRRRRRGSTSSRSASSPTARSSPVDGRRQRAARRQRRRARCSPTATRAPAAARRCTTAMLHGRGARRAGAARARSSCRARGARWTTSGSSSSRSRCCASSGRVKVALARMSANGGWAPADRRRARGAQARAARVRAARRLARDAGGVAAAPHARPQRRRTPRRCDLCGIGDPRGPPPPAAARPSAGSCARARRAGRCAPARATTARPGNRTLWLPEPRRPRRSVGELPDPDRPGVLHGLDGHRVRRRDVPEPGRGDRERAALRLLEPDASSSTRCSRGLEPDIEGLIVNRLADPPAYVIAPIDRCYALTGTIKAHWEGISGGRGVEEAVDALLRRAPRARRSPA